MKKIKKCDIIKKGIANHVRNEIKTLSIADNLYIQKYQGFGMDNKYVYIATELMTGGSFGDYLKTEVKLTEEKAK
jgi:serine/threonine protein kinase